MNDSDPAECPARIAAALARYRDEARRPGDALCAILSNDLLGFVSTASRPDMESLSGVIAWIERELPAESWGNRERVTLWLNVAEYRASTRGLRQAC